MEMYEYDLPHSKLYLDKDFKPTRRSITRMCCNNLLRISFVIIGCLILLKYQKMFNDPVVDIPAKIDLREVTNILFNMLLGLTFLVWIFYLFMCKVVSQSIPRISFSGFFIISMGVFLFMSLVPHLSLINTLCVGLMFGVPVICSFLNDLLRTVLLKRNNWKFSDIQIEGMCNIYTSQEVKKYDSEE